MKPIKRFVLRLSETDHAKLSAWAKREKRSLHAQIELLLQRNLEDEERSRYLPTSLSHKEPR